jgi:hypothetical protein
MNTSPSRAGSNRIVFGLLLAAAALLPASCGKKPDRKPVFQVSGKLVDGDKPAYRAVVLFHPADGAGRGKLQPAAKVAADGSFHVSTYLANDGAPPGEYAVTVIWPKVPADAPADWDEGPDQLEGRCSNLKTSPWRVRVEEKSVDMGTLDLQAWPKPSPPEKKTPTKHKPVGNGLD